MPAASGKGATAPRLSKTSVAVQLAKAGSKPVCSLKVWQRKNGVIGTAQPLQPVR